MKKLILILCLIFALTLCFVACEDLEDNSGGGQSQTEEPTTEKPICDIEQMTMVPLSDAEKENALISVLTEYLVNMHYSIYPGEITPFDERVKRGAQPLHIEFDPDDYYYMCCYYNVTHEYPEDLNCCVDKYTWVKFEDSNDIVEIYNGEKFIAAYQINKAAFVRDISFNAAVPEVEYFQIFDAQFDNGYNISESIYFNRTILYAYSSKQSVLFCYKPFFEYGKTVFCEKRQGEYYIVDKQYNFYSLDEFIKRYIKK